MALPNPYLAKPQVSASRQVEEAARRRLSVMPSTAPSKPKKPATTVTPGGKDLGVALTPRPPAQRQGPGAGGPVSNPSNGAAIGGPLPVNGARGSLNPDGSVTRGTPAPATSDSIDQMIRDRVAGELGSKTRDTSAEEALIRQQQDAAIGSGAVNARARAGRGGFESSGALMGLEGDIERQARAAATGQTLDVQDKARQEQFDRQQSVIDSELALRDSASNDFINQRLLDLLGMTDGDAAPATDSTDGNPFTNSNSETPATSGSGYSDVDPKRVDAIPAGATEVRPGLWVTTSNGRQTYYRLKGG